MVQVINYYLYMLIESHINRIMMVVNKITTEINVQIIKKKKMEKNMSIWHLS